MTSTAGVADVPDGKFAVLVVDPDVAGLPFEEGVALSGDTAADVVAQLIVGYGDVHGFEARALSRYYWLSAVGNQAKAVLFARAIGAGDVVYVDLAEEHVDALLNDPVTEPVFEGAEWGLGVPLVVMAESYADESLIPSGEGVIVLDGSTDGSLVDSLALVGAVEVYAKS